MTPPQGGKKMPLEEQIYGALLGIRDDIGSMRADIRTLFKKVDDLQVERRRADDKREKGDKALADDHDILAQRVVELETENKFVKRLIKMILVLAAVFGTGTVAKVSGGIDKLMSLFR